MDSKTVARYVSSLANLLIAASLLSALIWWRVGTYLFLAGGLGYGLARVMDGALRVNPQVASEVDASAH